MRLGAPLIELSRQLKLQRVADSVWRMRLKLQNKVIQLKESATDRWLKLNAQDDHLRAPTESATKMALELQERDEQIRTMALKLQEQDGHIRDLAKRAAELEKYEHLSTIMVARRHLEKAFSQISPTQPSYGSLWQPQVDAKRRDIPTLRDSMSCLHYAQKHITFDGRSPFPSELMEIQFREWAVENEFPDLAPVLRRMYDNPLSFPESLGEFNGRTVSRIFYYHARNVLAGITYANRPKRILEIGGGYGEIARLWLTNSIAPAESYVIVDIPECLFFAEIALKTEFGDHVGYFDGHDPGTKILLVPIPYLGDLTRPVDLVVNTGSMQEMTDEWIDFYTEWLAKYTVFLFTELSRPADIGHGRESQSMESASRRRMEHAPSSSEYSASRLGRTDPRFSRDPVRKIACYEKPKGVVDLPRPYPLQDNVCRGTRSAPTGLHH
jgi:putative sugar O-methyltransferase